MIQYYISGPMTGKPEFNHPTFLAVEDDLITYLTSTGSLNWLVVNPARNFGGVTDLARHVYLSKDIQQVLDSDVLVLIDGWEASPGARLEVDVARNTGKGFMIAKEITATGGYSFTAVDLPDLNAIPSSDSKPESVRGGMLDEAKHLVTGDRNAQYGEPDQDFARTAGMVTAFGFSVNGGPVNGHHIAIFMNLLKVSRLAWTPTKRDSWVDAAGYAACGLETALLQESRREAA